jgi:hypothetical protein
MLIPFGVLLVVSVCAHGGVERVFADLSQDFVWKVTLQSFPGGVHLAARQPKRTLERVVQCDDRHAVDIATHPRAHTERRRPHALPPFSPVPSPLVIRIARPG